MMDEYFAVPISPSNKRAMAQMDALLAREGIERDRNLTYSAAIYDDDGQMIATGWEFVWLKAQIKWHDRDGTLRLDTREYLIRREDVLEDIAFTQVEGIKFWKLVETGVRPALKLPEV